MQRLVVIRHYVVGLKSVREAAGLADNCANGDYQIHVPFPKVSWMYIRAPSPSCLEIGYPSSIKIVP